jgi:hypothetical protein
MAGEEDRGSGLVRTVPTREMGKARRSDTSLVGKAAQGDAAGPHRALDRVEANYGQPANPGIYLSPVTFVVHPAGMACRLRRRPG